MDDESKQILREILDLQREQTKLLRAYLLPPWMRMRFSVRSLLILMTLVAVVLGFLVFLKTLRATSPQMLPVKTPVVVVPAAK
jgi:hypothetical protein